MASAVRAEDLLLLTRVVKAKRFGFLTSSPYCLQVLLVRQELANTTVGNKHSKGHVQMEALTVKMAAYNQDTMKITGSLHALKSQ